MSLLHFKSLYMLHIGPLNGLRLRLYFKIITVSLQCRKALPLNMFYLESNLYFRCSSRASQWAHPGFLYSFSENAHSCEEMHHTATTMTAPDVPNVDNDNIFATTSNVFFYNVNGRQIVLSCEHDSGVFPTWLGAAWDSGCCLCPSLQQRQGQWGDADFGTSFL